MYQHSYTSLWVHLIWSTKHREPLIEPHIKHALYQQLRKIAEELGYHIDFINGTADHIHLLVSLHPTFNVSTVVKNLKGRSWQWMRAANLTHDYFSWQDGYAAISVSPSNVNKVRNYIKNQEKHHRQKDFTQELLHVKAISFVGPADDESG